MKRRASLIFLRMKEGAKRRLFLILRSAKDEVVTLISYRPALVILFLLPLIYPATVAWLYSTNTAVERPAVVIDQDNSSLSRMFIRWVDATRDVNVIERIDSVEEGWDLIRRHQVEVMIFIPKDFSTHVKKAEHATFKVWVNGANIYTLGTSLPGLYGAVGTLNAAINMKYLMSKGVSPSTAAAKVAPISIDNRNLFRPFGGYGEFFAPGIMLMVIHQMMLICFGFSVGYQRFKGTFKLSESVPFLRLFGKIFVHLPFYFASAAFIVYIVMPLSGWPPGNPGMCMVLYSVLIVAMIPFSIFAASLLPDHIAALEFMMFLSAPLFLMSGFTWPFDEMPHYLKSIASAFPGTPALQALRMVLTKSSQCEDLLPYFTWMAKLFCIYAAAAIAYVNIAPRLFDLCGRLFKKKHLQSKTGPIVNEA